MTGSLVKMILIDRMDPGFISRIYKNKKISITRERKEKKQGMRAGSEQGAVWWIEKRVTSHQAHVNVTFLTTNHLASRQQ